MAQAVRIGIIGAGGFTRRQLLPRFIKIPGVELVAVGNRSLESSQRAAEEFEIPIALADWRDMLSNDDIDAVFVGTQPYFHAEAVVAALDAGKHVLCQTRDGDESAGRPRDAGQGGGDGLAGDARTVGLVPEGPPLREAPSGHRLRGPRASGVLVLFRGQLRRRRRAVHRRQDHRNFGAINPLHLGIDWDVLRPWFGDPRRVVAWGTAFTPERADEGGGPPVTVEMPDAITVIAEMPGGEAVTCVQSGVAHFGEERVEVYGDAGTLVYNRQSGLQGGRAGDAGLAELPVPDEYAESWQAEETSSVSCAESRRRRTAGSRSTTA